MVAETKYYWGIKVPKSISENEEIYLHADVVEIINGDLIFRREKDNLIIFSLSRGNWHAFFAASLVDGHPCYVKKTIKNAFYRY